MAHYGVQWRRDSTDWWHDFPGSFLTFTDEAEAKEHYVPFLSKVRTYSEGNAEFRLIRMPLHNITELNW